MQNWDDPLGLDKTKKTEKTTAQVVENEVAAKSKVAPAPLQKTKKAEQSEKIINQTPENRENNEKLALEPVNPDDKRVKNRRAIG